MIYLDLLDRIRRLYQAYVEGIRDDDQAVIMLVPSVSNFSLCSCDQSRSCCGLENLTFGLRYPGIPQKPQRKRLEKTLASVNFGGDIQRKQGLT